MGHFEVTAVIRAPPSRVWQALTDPAQVRLYTNGARLSTDWSVGAPVTWTGELDGEAYENKGTVLSFVPEQLLRYTFWSNTSALEDHPRNYATITCKLRGEKGGTRLDVAIDDSGPAVASRHMDFGWELVGGAMKRFLEGT